MKLERNKRSGLINWQRHQLFMPRLQMILILFLTGCVGFLSSVLFLHSGILQMWLRYPLAILSAYIVFLLLLRLWLAVYRLQSDKNLNVNVDLPIDVDVGITSSANGEFNFGGGGDFGGGGAGGNWGDSISSPSGDSSSIFDGISLDMDLEDIGLLVIAVIVLIGGFVASLYVVYIAPFLLAELLIDGVLLNGLYKRLKHIERNHWLQTAVRKTIIPMLLSILFFGIAGGALQRVVPAAKSVGEVWNLLRTSSSVN